MRRCSRLCLAVAVVHPDSPCSRSLLDNAGLRRWLTFGCRGCRRPERGNGCRRRPGPWPRSGMLAGVPPATIVAGVRAWRNGRRATVSGCPGGMRIDQQVGADPRAQCHGAREMRCIADEGLHLPVIGATATSASAARSAATGRRPVSASASTCSAGLSRACHRALPVSGGCAIRRGRRRRTLPGGQPWQDVPVAGGRPQLRPDPVIDRAGAGPHGLS